MPTIVDPADINRLLPEEPQDDVLWHMLQDGKLWHGHLASTPVGQVGVSVLNGTGIAGLAGRTAARLRKLGFHVTHVGDAAATSYTTVSYLGSAQAGGAYTLMNALNQEPAAQDGISGPVTLTIGSDFGGVHALPHHRHGTHARAQQASSSSGQPAVETRNAAANICSAMPAANTDVGTPP